MASAQAGGRPRRLVRRAGRAVERITGRPLRDIDGPIAFEAKVAVARAIYRAERRRGRVNVNVPGWVLLQADPRAVSRLAGRLPLGSVAISASNGKTTTTAMLASITRAAGLSPVTNATGENLPSGLAAELLAATRTGRGTVGDVGVFEVDERYLAPMVEEIGVRVLVLGNLMRDQLDRMGGPDAVLGLWRALVAEQRGRPDAVSLVLCADDPRVASLAELSTDPLLFGIESAGTPSAPALAAGVARCPRCDGPYTYEAMRVAPLGRYRCQACGAGRPNPAVAAEDIDVGTTSTVFTLRVPAGRWPVRLPLGGLHNVYNALAAAGGAVALGIDPAHVVAGLEAVPAAWGRGEVVSVHGADVVLLLLKSAASGEPLVRLLESEGEPLDLLLAADDPVYAPREIGWLWDVDLERLSSRVRNAVCTGSRAAELALRLRYAGVAESRICVEPELSTALHGAVSGSQGRVHAVAVPPAAVALREVLADEGLVRRYWQ